MIDYSRCLRSPYNHQKVGIESLYKWNDPDVGRVFGGCFALFDDMGAGKTFQVIISALSLFLDNYIDRVIVVAPAAVRSVWYDPDFGEIRKHSFPDVPKLVHEYHSKERMWGDAKKGVKFLHWIITNYEFVRAAPRLEELISYCDKRTLLVLDESSAVKSHRALQTKACIKLRAKCGRVVLLNGTPIANNPGDLYAQAKIMDPRILDCKDYFKFRARYAIMGGYMQKQITGWRDLEDLQRRLKPYILRRLKEDCLDLPEKLDPVIHTVALTPASWKIYKAMRDDMVSWLNDSTVSTASQAIVKAMRLAQITSGFLGGIEELSLEEDFGAENDSIGKPAEDQEIGREKMDHFLDWLKDRLYDDPGFKVLVWCRFRSEIKRLYAELQKIPGLNTGLIWGGQKRGSYSETEKPAAGSREEALRLLSPETAPKGPVVVLGTPATGSMGLNLTAAHTVVYLSNDHSLKTRLQSEDRVHRPGQVHAVSYFDYVATGPEGQKTIDHLIIKSLQSKEALANWTISAWISALSE